MATRKNISRKPDFQLLQRALLNQRTDIIPLIELGIDPYIKSNILGRPWQGIEDDVEFMSLMGYDFVKIQPRINFHLEQELTSKETGTSSGSAGSDRAWAPESTGVITNWSEFEKYNWPEKSQIDYANFEKIRKILPDGMGVIGQYGDIFTLVWELMGFENFAMAIYEQPDLVEALLNKVADLVLGMFDTMADMDWVGALWYSDDIAYSSGLMIHPDIFRKYFFPLLNHIGILTKKREIPFIYHSDGVLWDVMDDIINSGVTSLHPIEPKSMDIFEVEDKVGDKLALCGGVEVDLLSRGDESEVIKLVTQFLDQLSEKGGYCAGSSNSVPEYVKIDNYLAMVKTVIEYKIS